MKLVLVNPQELETDFDNKKTEIKKYLDNLDFVQDKSKEINFLKRVALLLLNEEETGAITLEYENGKLNYRNNLEYLVASKILKRKEILIKLVGQEEEFIQKYNAIESNLQTIENMGFINWEEKNQITKDDWNDIEFLKERIIISSFNDVLEELIRKKNKIYLSPKFLDEIMDAHHSNQYDYFPKLSLEELKSITIIKFLEDKHPETLVLYLEHAFNKSSEVKDKELTNIIKNELINEDNITIFKNENIKDYQQYIPAKLRSHQHIIETLVNNMTSSNVSYNHKLNLDESIKIIGKKYLSDKENFIYFVDKLSQVPMRTNESTDKIIKEVINQFDLNNEQDKKLFEFLVEGNMNINQSKVNGGVINMILKHNYNSLNKKEKISLYAKGLIELEQKEILGLTNNEEDLEILLNNSQSNYQVSQTIKEKVKEINSLEEFITKKTTIVDFLKIAFPNDWLKNKTVPQSWKEDNDLLIETYSKNNYKDLPLAKRKELEEDKNNVIYIMKQNIENFAIIRNENKYDLSILKKLAYEQPNNFKDILEEVPKKKWFNFNFALKMLDYAPDALHYIPKALYDNKQFTLNVFEIYEKRNGYNMKDLLSELPEELKSFLQDNNITSDYLSLLNKHFVKDNLEITLNVKNDKTKKMKI